MTTRRMRNNRVVRPAEKEVSPVDSASEYMKEAMDAMAENLKEKLGLPDPGPVMICALLAGSQGIVAVRGDLPELGALSNFIGTQMEIRALKQRLDELGAG